MSSDGLTLTLRPHEVVPGVGIAIVSGGLASLTVESALRSGCFRSVVARPWARETFLKRIVRRHHAPCRGSSGGQAGRRLLQTCQPGLTEAYDDGGGGTVERMIKRTYDSRGNRLSEEYDESAASIIEWRTQSTCLCYF